MISGVLVKPHGFTLIETIVAIVIVGMCAVAVVSTITYSGGRSADPALQRQGVLIAEAYMEEILLKSFVDPSVGTAQVCPAPESGGRIAYDNVCDYNGLTDIGARNQFNSPVTGLEAYTVTVTVKGDATVLLGPAASPVNNTDVVRVLRVDVQVQGPGSTNVRMTGYRTNYACNQTGDAACLPL